jgi:hypothetical protein
MARKLPRIYQIKVTLNGVKPPIWRRLRVSSITELTELHDILQIAMGWTDSHLHMFVVGDRQYGIPDPDFEDETISEEGIRIDTLLKKEKDSLIYEYDFGDGWEHTVVLETIIDSTPDETVPRCMTGRRGCPPEDVGGIWGYEEFLQAYSDESHPEHEDFVQWAGEYFDPERFDLLEVNEILGRK